MSAKSTRLVGFGTMTMLLLCVVRAGSAQQLDENCTVSVLNRNVQVNPDGTWLLPNIPANFGPVRARVTCVIDGKTVSGESDPFVIPPNGSVNVPPIAFGRTTAIPAFLTISAPSGTLTQPGDALQLAVSARYPDGTTRDVAAAANGTVFTISNPAIATISLDGVVRAVGSGTAIVQATLEGASGIFAVKVAFADSDSDGDGIPDADELRMGLNPNEPTDAFEDLDRDGLSNREEYTLGTDPRNADSDSDGLSDGREVALGTSALLRDTDGDGVSDGLEVQAGTDPLNPTSVNVAAALRSVALTPSQFGLTFSTLTGPSSRQLSFTGTMVDGAQIDLTATRYGTSYASSNLGVCNFGATDGRVYAGGAGSCTITATIGTFRATAIATVATFFPSPLSFVAIPGFANGVDVNGNVAFVAAGAAGLQVVDVSDRGLPQIVAALPLPGNANDVTLSGSRAYVAAGSAGLHVIDVSDPIHPALVTSTDTPGDATGVRVAGNLAFIADGPAGLQIVNVASDSSGIVGSVATAGLARGVDIAGTLALVAAGGLQVIDVMNPLAPAILGEVSLPDAARDVVVDGAIAYVADYQGSLQVVDFSAPTAPRVIGTTPAAQAGTLTGVALAVPFLFGADVRFTTTAVPIVNVAAFGSPVTVTSLNFVTLRNNDKGTGIAVDGNYVYLTTSRGVVENGATDAAEGSRLYIGQYRPFEDLGSVPPTVTIVSPAPGTTVVEGEVVTFTASAKDDVAVAKVDFTIDGTVVFTDTRSPYQYVTNARVGSTSLTVGATATDLAFNTSATAQRQVTVIPDPFTTVVGRVVDAAEQPLNGARVSAFGRTSTTGADGRFSLAGVPTVQPAVIVNASLARNGTVMTGISAPTPPVRLGITNVGDIATIALAYESAIGTRRTACTGCDITLAIPFAFPANTTTYSQVNISSVSARAYFRGSFSLWPLNEFLIPDPHDPLSGLYVNDTLVDRFVVTWFRMLGQFGGPNTIQLTLFADGRIQFNYHGLITYFGNALVGARFEGGPSSWLVDFSSMGTLVVSEGSISETFVRDENPFDLDGSFLLFTPRTEGGYEVRTIADVEDPVCQITGPVHGSTVFEGERLLVAATATDNGTVRRVTFGSSVGTLNGVDTAAPYGAPFVVPVGATEVTLTATAYDTWNNAGVCSTTLNVAPGPPPVIAIASHAPGAAVTEGATIAVTVEMPNRVPARRVDLSVNGVVLSTATKAPFQLFFTVPAGVSSIALSAAEVDTVGKRGTSTPVTLTVVPDTFTTVQGSVVTRTRVPVGGAQAAAAVNGVTLEIFDFGAPLTALPDLAGRTPDRVTIASAVNLRNPGSLFGPDPFGFGARASHASRLTGNLDAARAGTYTFQLGVKDGGRLIVNGVTVVDMPPGSGQFREASGTIVLAAGSVPIQILAYDNGNPEMQLSYAPPDDELQIVPPTALTPTIAPYQTISGPTGGFTIAGVPTRFGNIGASAAFVDAAGKTLTGRSIAVPPVPAGVTSVGPIRVIDRAVLLLADADTPGTQSLATALQAAGNTVTVRPPPEYTWNATNPPLAGFDVVIHLNGATWSQSLPQQAQTALVDFVRNGGGYIGGQWNGFEVFQGKQLKMPDLVLQSFTYGPTCGPCDVTYEVVPEQADHRVLKGVPAQFTFSADGHAAGDQVAFAVNPSTVLMRVPDTTSAVLVREFGSGRIVSFSFAPNYLGAAQSLQDPNVQRLYVNAVAWLQRR